LIHRHRRRSWLASRARLIAPLLALVCGLHAARAATPALTAERRIVLDLSSRTISLREDQLLLGSWPVAIGDPASPTPTGRYSVLNKVINPRYQSTRTGRLHPTVGSDAPLGDRWLGFLQRGRNQFGIHGTPDAWAWAVLSRAAVTNGCVRMLRQDIHELFDQVELGTPVIVTR